jgi:hypothetical protein
VEEISSWPKERTLTYEERISTRITTYPFDLAEHNYLLFDNAHLTYWDTELWEVFFKDTVQSGSGPMVVLFCSYGSPGVEDDDATTPLRFSACSRVSLRPLCNHEYHPPISLLFTPIEFKETLQRFLGKDQVPLVLDEELQNILSEWTDGHAGAVSGLLSKMSDAVRVPFHCANF